MIIGTVAIFSIINLITNPESKSDPELLIFVILMWAILIGSIFLMIKLFKKWNLGNEGYP